MGLLPKCANIPDTHTDRFAYSKSIPTILCTLEGPTMSGWAVLSAYSRTCHIFPWVTSFLANYPQQCTITIVKPSWCPPCEIFPDNMPHFPHTSMRCHRQWYLRLWTIAVVEAGLGKFADCSNVANTHAGCNIYRWMNVDQLHRLLMGSFEDRTWNCIISGLKDIYSQEKGLDIIDE